MSLERRTKIIAAWDCILLPAPACLQHEDCDPKIPNKSYGRGGIRIYHYLIGPELVVQFVWAPGVYLPETERWAIDSGRAVSDSSFGFPPSSFFEPRAWDLGWHLPAPMPSGFGEDSYGSRFVECEFFENGCYYDGSSLNADPLMEVMIRRGGEAMWGMLTEYYQEVEAQSVGVKDGVV